MQSRRPAPEFYRLARRMLGKDGAELDTPERAAEALQAVLKEFHGHLSRLVGDGGFRSLLGLAHLRAMAENPALEEVIVTSHSNPFIEPSGLAGEDGSPDERLTGAFVDLIAELLLLVRILGRDQDWSVAQIWPSLVSLESTTPRSGTDGS